ncbi:hypothetical protein ACSX1C_00315 [Pseudomonas sp. MBLB4123]|uniref:hypothetical protein n=1 Tax=Pseudomonas sp. MBLB4123 TaxID=3451557 RepID=UPI003F74C106
MRIKLNDASSEKLLRIMEHYKFTNTNHSLNVIIGNLHQALFENNHKNPIKEVDINAAKENLPPL